jgi:hypothetical protein
MKRCFGYYTTMGRLHVYSQEMAVRPTSFQQTGKLHAVERIAANDTDHQLIAEDNLEKQQSCPMPTSRRTRRTTGECQGYIADIPTPNP